mmetsp:Transcript_16144/g.16276  ORF Transcript_16144/g.16276 Transcript_16144/m.16276 type:complete len:150 (-) Transcript_16144:78-527(-)
MRRISHISWGGYQHFLQASLKMNLSTSTDANRLRNNLIEIPKEVEPILSLATANQKEITNAKINASILKYQSHSIDSGSAPVQIAVMTEKILNLARHFAVHRKDNHSRRGFEMLISRRRRMMQYLKRKDVVKFKETVISLGLQKEAGHL